MAVPGRRIKAPGTAFFIMRFSQVHIYDTIINYSYIYRRRILKQIKIDENGIHIVFGITDNDQIKLLHFSHAGFCENDITKKHESLKESEDRQEQFIDEGYQLVQVNVSGYDRPYEKHGNKHISTVPGYLLKYTGMKDERNGYGRRLIITQEDKEVTGIRTETEMQFYDGISTVRFKNRVTNIGTQAQTLEEVSSFTLWGIEKEGEKSPDDKLKLAIPFNGWQKEVSWHTFTMDELGMARTQPTVADRTSCTIEVTNTGNWSAKKFLPMGFLMNTEAHTGLFWEIEHNGSWHYEIGDQNNHFYLTAEGPNEVQSHWYKQLLPGETFESVPAAAGVSADNWDDAMSELTRYRRIIRRPNRDDEELPVIFNDYMNCLFGDPTTAKELPLIDAAAAAGCEYFVIDAGWYAPGQWWDSVGEWQESKERFPNGISEVTDHIRSKGMIPGLWLELEVMGINCHLAGSVPDDWFFMRHGRRVYDRSRYQLDFRNPEVISHMNDIIDRVVRDYHIGYIKMDYNIEPGIGTETNADSVGDGMLQHERAYLKWLEDVFARYPELVIENCSSGGLRMDYAMLSRYSIQSTSDQEDYREYATIAANTPTGVTPEQAAVWSYPMKGKGREEVIFNMVNALLRRIHQSGHLAQLPAENVALVTEGISCYKHIRHDIRTGLPFWPCGLADNLDSWLCSGLRVPDEDGVCRHAYLAVWKRDKAEQVPDRYEIPVREAMLSDESSGYGGTDKAGKIRLSVECIYPADEGPARHSYNDADGIMTVSFPDRVMARLYEIKTDDCL
jgi:alpha-galactosidase